MRRSNGGHTNPLAPVSPNATSPKTFGPNAAPPVFDSANWSGEVLLATGNQVYNYVRGTIVVPHVKVPNGYPLEPTATPGYYDSVAWVG
jgi:hypothetical protein